jgi:hypothetical protein
MFLAFHVLIFILVTTTAYAELPFEHYAEKEQQAVDKYLNDDDPDNDDKYQKKVDKLNENCCRVS